MSAFEDFWLAIGDRINVGVPPADRSIEMRRVLAARAFERWRTGRLDISREVEALQVARKSGREL